jgi:hypothetical protein
MVVQPGESLLFFGNALRHVIVGAELFPIKVSIYA